MSTSGDFATSVLPTLGTAQLTAASTLQGSKMRRSALEDAPTESSNPKTVGYLQWIGSEDGQGIYLYICSAPPHVVVLNSTQISEQPHP